jgi:hypothetical protein
MLDTPRTCVAGFAQRHQTDDHPWKGHNMTTYAEITKQLGDQWIEGIKKAEEALTKLADNVTDAASNLPQVPTPEALTRFNEAVAERLPNPREVIEANFDLTQRLLAAHRDFSLSLLGRTEAAPAPADKPAPKKA